MSRYTIFPADRSLLPLDMVAQNTASVLHMINKQEWYDADVCVDGAYAFSTHMAKSGFWCLFQRDLEDRPECIPEPPALA